MSKHVHLLLAFSFLSALTIITVLSEPDGVVASASSSKVDPVPQAYDLPPSPGPVVPAGPVGPGGFFGFPGLGAGISKNFDFNAYAGYGGFPGYFGGGFGGPGPAVPVDGDIPPPVGGPGFGGPGFGGFGPSYLPQTWLGSALGAKGDILFPIVIVIFFIVGVWAVINFLLALVVPLIAAKIGVVGATLGSKKLRSADEADEDEQIELADKVGQAVDGHDDKYADDQFL